MPTAASIMTLPELSTMLKIGKSRHICGGLALLGALATSAFSDATPTTSPRPTVAVYADPQESYVGQLADTGQLANFVTQELVSSSKFAVIDREHMRTVLNEQNYAGEGQVTPNTVAQIGRMLGANYIMVARIDSFTATLKARSDVFSVLGAQTYVTDLDLTDHLEIVNVRSGQIVQSIPDKRSASSQAYTAVGQAIGRAFVQGETPKLLAQSAAAMVAKMDLAEMTSTQNESHISGRILSIDGDDIILSLGSDAGITTGQILDFFDARVISNPDDGKRITVLIKRGSLQVVQVSSNYSVAKSIHGKPKRNQIVKPE